MTRSLRLAQKIYADGSKLIASDLLSKEDYERERADLLRLATQHRKQRRLRLNPSLSLIFETRFTAWLQIQEELRWLSHPAPQDVAEVLTRCNLLVLKPDELTATLFVDGGDHPASLYWIECCADAHKNHRVACLQLCIHSCSNRPLDAGLLPKSSGEITPRGMRHRYLR